MQRLMIALTFLLLLLSLKSASQQRMSQQKQFISLKPLPQNFYTQHLGFFCKKEVHLQRMLPVQVFFRLGTKEYVDLLEKKPGSFYLKK